MMRIKKIFIAAALVLISAFTLVGCNKNKASNNANEATVVSKLVISDGALELYAGESDKIRAYTTTEEEISYSSDNAEIATVDSSGNVTAVSEGETYVYVTAGEHVKSCKVTVHAVTYAISLDAQDIKIVQGTVKGIRATVTKNGEMCSETVKWSVLGEAGTIIIDGNTVSFKATTEGTVTLTAEIGDVSENCTITVITVS